MWGYVAAYLAGLTTIPAIVLALGALADFDCRPTVSKEERRLAEQAKQREQAEAAGWRFLRGLHR
jgi:hypothetical protein